MDVIYPAEQFVSIWIGTFESEDAFDSCVNQAVESRLGLEVELASICEVGFESEAVTIRELLNGFSGCETFLPAATQAADALGISSGNAALVCYNLHCQAAPSQWSSLIFLGSMKGTDIPS